MGPRIYSTAKGFFGNEDINSLEDARNVLRRNSDFLKTETIKAYAIGDRRHRQWIAQAARELGLSPTNEGDADFIESGARHVAGFVTAPRYFASFIRAPPSVFSQ